MVTGASTADLAVILVDARKGMLPQTRRHTLLVSLLGIHASCSPSTRWIWSARPGDVRPHRRRSTASSRPGLGLAGIAAIPISALRGDNVPVSSENMPWYDGPSLAEYLDTVEVDRDAVSGPFRLAVQTVTGPDLDFRGYAGVVAGGTVRPGDEVRVLPSGAIGHGGADRDLGR